MSVSLLNVLLNIVTVLLTGGALGIVLRYRQGMRSLANVDAADIRDHYAEELQRVIDRQRACEERERKLQLRVTKLEGILVERDNDILGLIRIITQASADKVLLLDSRASEMIESMALRIKNQRYGTE